MLVTNRSIMKNQIAAARLQAFASEDNLLDPHDFSLRLITYVIAKLESEGVPKPTQSQIASRLQVTQPMVHAVLYGDRNFSEDIFLNYAKELRITFSTLAADLMLIADEAVRRHRLRSIRRKAADPAQALFALYDLAHTNLEKERGLSNKNSDRAFDHYKAYGEILAFAHEASNLIGDRPLAFAVVIEENDRYRAIWSVACSDSDEQVRRILDDKSSLARLTSYIEDRSCSDSHVESQVTWAECPQGISEIVESWCNAEELVFLGRKAYEDPAYLGATCRAKVFVVGICADIGQRPHHRAQVISFASRLVERVASYAVEDELRCSQLMLDARLQFGDSLGNISEVAEAQVSKLIDEFERRCIQNLPQVSASLATCDIWLYYLATKDFVCPSREFRRVFKANHNYPIQIADYSEPLSVVYDREFNCGSLVPKPFGKTRHMIGTHRALVINQSDNRLRSTFWASSHPLELGTFIGIPALFSPSGSGGASFIFAMYLRLTEDLPAKLSVKVISEVVRSMRSVSRGRVFLPLLQVKSSKASFDYEQFHDSDRGVWYEVFGKRDQMSDTREVHKS